MPLIFLGKRESLIKSLKTFFNNKESMILFSGDSLKFNNKHKKLP